MKTTLVCLTALALLSAPVNNAWAGQPLASPASFSGSETIVDFEGLGLESFDFLPPNTTLGGATFSLSDGGTPRFIINVSEREYGPPGFGLIRRSIWRQGGGEADDPDMVITFAEEKNRLGLETITFGATLDLEFRSAGSVVDTASFAPGVGSSPFKFFGYETASPFDELILNNSNLPPGQHDHFNIDNLRFEYVEPPPPPPPVATIIDFETGSHGHALPGDTYRDLGAKMIGAVTFEAGQGGWDLAHSPTRGMVPGNLVSIDGTTAEQIVIDHVGATTTEEGVADVLFVMPGTDEPATVDSFSMWIGFDPLANPAEGNHIIIEAFDAAGVKLMDFTRTNLIGVDEELQSFNVTGTARLRLTQAGGVGFDDLTLGQLTPAAVPEPSGFLLGAMGVLGGVGLMRRRRRITRRMNNFRRVRVPRRVRRPHRCLVTLGLLIVALVPIVGSRPALAAPGDLVHSIFNPTPEMNDQFGNAIATVGDMIIVGAYRDSTTAAESGSAYVFDGATGNLLRTLANPTPGAGDWFGFSMAAVGDNVLISSRYDDTGATDTGAVYLIDPATADVVRVFANPTPGTNDQFGVSVAPMGNNILVGSWRDSDAAADRNGIAYLLNGSDGSLIRTFHNPTPNNEDRFAGNAIAAVGDNVLVSAYHDDTGAHNAGAAYLFDGSTGALLQTFLNPTPQADDQFGVKVAAFNDKVLIGSRLDDAGGPDAGAVYMYDPLGGAILHTFQNPNPGVGDQFGYAIAQVGDNVLIGSRLDDSGASRAGAAYLFDGDTGELLQTYLNPSPDTDEFFGDYVAALGNRVVIGGIDDNAGAKSAGAAYVFEGNVVSPPPQRFLIDFENTGLAEGDLLTTQIPGLTFVGAMICEEGNPSFGFTGDRVTSGEPFGGAFISDPVGPGGGYLGNPGAIEVLFDTPVAELNLRVADLDGDASPRGDLFLGRAFGADGTLLETISIHSAEPGTGDNVATLITFESSGISRLTMNVSNSADLVGWGVDNLSFVQVPEPSASILGVIGLVGMLALGRRRSAWG